MVGARENISSKSNYGMLHMQSYDIDGNKINAFYDSNDNLIFVLDNTISEQKPNVLLVINPDADKKWDEILSNEYGVDLETIRPKQDNKYQKLDIEYSGLDVYENLITAYNAGDDLQEYINELNILRDSAARHSAVVRLNTANEIINKTNTTIIKTKETIIKIQARIKSLRTKLSETKKEIGKVSTKQSASKILKLESQIEAANEKLNRAKKRLISAQRRLEVATVDAELASNLLNKPSTKTEHTVKSKPVMVAPKHDIQTIDAEEESLDDIKIPDFDEDDEEEDEEDFEISDIEPLFDKDPQILNENIAFKPITFDTPSLSSSEKENDVQETTEMPVLNQDMFNNVLKAPEPEEEPKTQSEPEPQTVPEPVEQSQDDIVEKQPILDTISPVVPPRPLPPAPIMESKPLNAEKELESETERNISIAEPATEKNKQSFIYYFMLIILIVLSIFTLWLYQKNVVNGTPTLAVKNTESATAPIVAPNIATDKDSTKSDYNNEYEDVFISIPATDEPEPIIEPTEVSTTENLEEPVVVPPEPDIVPITDDTNLEPEVGLIEQSEDYVSDTVVETEMPNENNMDEGFISESENEYTEDTDYDLESPENVYEE